MFCRSVRLLSYSHIFREEREVLRDSAEAKAHFSSLHTFDNPPSNLAQPESSSQLPTPSTTAKPALQPHRPLKRASALDAAANKQKPTKLNVLEKSRLDWAGFVDKEGIGDDLTRFNKNGYVEKQEFLHRAGNRGAR